MDNRDPISDATGPIGQIVQSFAATWKQGQPMSIDDFRHTAGVDRQDLLVALVHTDLQRRLDSGEPARVESYVSRYPELAREVKVLLQLIATEFTVRERLEPGLTVDEYAQRFPEHWDNLSTFLNPADPYRTRVAGPGGETPSDLPALAAAAHDFPRVPDHEILGVLGRGGMGVVYKARHERLKRLVAVKMVLAGAQAESEERERFGREAEAVAQLQHPNIVQIYEVGEADGRPYFSLEFVAGGSLQQQIAGKPQPPRPAAAQVESLARAMHLAHQRGIVHRDLKPANILVSGGEEGGGQPGGGLTPHQLKITDFGLAKQLETDSGQTRNGAIMGTPSYMAPEQALGQTVGPLADVYALGGILYELLTGRPPFVGATLLDTLDQVKNQEPVPPSRLQPKAPRDLETICLKCLQKEPARRYTSALALAEDLRRFLDDEPILARPTGAWGHLKKWARRRPAVAALSATSILLAAVGFGLVTWKWLEAESAQAAEAAARRNAEAAQHAESVALQKEQAAHQKAGVALLDAKTNLYHASLALAEQEWQAGNADRAEEMLDACPPDLRGWEWHYAKRRCHSELLTFRGAGAAINSVRFSADGRRLISASGELMQANAVGEIKIWDAATGQELLALKGAVGQEHKGPITSVAFSPDGKLAASASLRLDWAAIFKGDVRASHAPAGEVKLWDATTGKEVRTLPGFGNVAFHGSKPQLAFGGLDGRVKVWDTETASEVFDLPGLTGLIESIVYSPDGTRLAAASSAVDTTEKGPVVRKNTIKVWDAGTGKELATVAAGSSDIGPLAFSPDGKRLAWTGENHGIVVADSLTGKEWLTLRGHSDSVLGLSYSPDGKQLASAGKDQVIRVWDAGTGQQLFAMRGHAGPVLTLAYDPAANDGAPRLIAGGKDGLLKLWSVRPSDPVRLLEGHRAFIRHAVFAPVGGRLATSGADNTVRVWDMAAGKELWKVDWNGERIAFSPDGARIAASGGSQVQFDQPGHVKVWNAADGRELLTLSGHTMFVGGVAFSPDGRRLASVSGNMQLNKVGEVILWDLASGRAELTFVPPLGCLSSVAFSPDGKSLALAGLDRKVQLCDAASGKELRTWTGTGITLAFSPDGGQLASGGEDGATVWDVATGRELQRLRGRTGTVATLSYSSDGRRLVAGGLNLSGGKMEVTVWDTATGRQTIALPGLVAVAFSPDGGYLVAAEGQSVLKSKALQVWDGTPGPEMLTLRGRAGNVFGIAISPDNELIASGHDEQGIKLWEQASGRELRTLRGHSGTVMQVAFSPDGRRLASASTDETVRIWDVASGRELRTLRGHKGWVRSVAFSPDGSQVASAGYDKLIKLWDSDTGKELRSLQGHTEAVFTVAYSPEGTYLASGGRDKSVRIWETATGTNIQTLRGHSGPVAAIAYSPSGSRLASAGGDRMLRLWDPTTGQELQSFQAHYATVFGVAFSPDGRRLASAGEDQRLLIWDIAGGRSVACLRGHTSTIYQVAFSRDGKFIASSSFDRTVKVWAAPKAPACAAGASKK